MENKIHISYLERIGVIIDRIEDGLLVGLLMLMIGMAVAQIFLRELFELSIVWGDVMVRVLVLWIGLVGAMIASREGKHIHIDLISRFLPERAEHSVIGVVNLSTTLICMMVAWYSFEFVRMEYQSGGIAFAGVPNWACEAILPIAFIVIAVRYFLLSIISFRKMKNPLP